jgi:hypothetical protein
VSDYDYDDEDLDDVYRWTCCFPGKCLMPGEHLRDECHTIEMIEAFNDERAIDHAGPRTKMRRKAEER